MFEWDGYTCTRPEEDGPSIAGVPAGPGFRFLLLRFLWGFLPTAAAVVVHKGEEEVPEDMETEEMQEVFGEE